MNQKIKNLIIITSDEMRGNCLGISGNPDIKTPNIDVFAGEGVYFSKHFACHGKCVPSRIALSTGRYAHTGGFRTIFNHLDPGKPDLLLKLKNEGYQTAVLGLNHVWKDLFSSNEVGKSYADYHSYTGKYDKMMKDDEQKRRQREWKANREVPKMEDGWDYRGSKGRIISSDECRAEQAIDFLTKTRDKSKPFYLQLNFSNPHPPYGVEEPYFSMYDRDKIEAWPHQLPENAPFCLKANREVRTRENNTEANLREIQAVYYGMISKVDDLFARVYKTIQDEGLLEDSLIIFTVDHGDFAGQYGLVEKWDSCLADCLLHVPLIMRAPGLPAAKKITSLSQHTDLAPTILNLMGHELDWNVHGQDLMPVIEGKKEIDTVFADGGHEEEMRKRFPSMARLQKKNGERDAKQECYYRYPQAMARAKMARSQKYKLIMREDGDNEFYDLENDPFETKNIYDKEKYAKEIMELQEKLIYWSIKTDPDTPYQKNIGA